jgi:nicotinate-nucleotide--dimethylbenzimidazole phosphoribosyltransferase
MTEILTESFCERCGTRYTFESAAPHQHRMGGIRTLGRGLRNFVLSDDSSLDEAMAEARSDVEREATAQQLDAFHRTFNFCMSCRQYTCGNCWNDVEARCLSCAPVPEAEMATAAFVAPPGEVDLGRLLRLTAPPSEAAAPSEAAWPAEAGWPSEATVEPELVGEAEVAIPAAAEPELVGEAEAAVSADAELAIPAEAELELVGEAEAAASDAAVSADAELEAFAAVEAADGAALEAPEALVTDGAEAGELPEWATLRPPAEEPIAEEPIPAEPIAEEPIPAEPIAAASPVEASLAADAIAGEPDTRVPAPEEPTLEGLEPGESLDDAIAAYEAAQAEASRAEAEGPEAAHEGVEGGGPGVDIVGQPTWPFAPVAPEAEAETQVVAEPIAPEPEPLAAAPEAAPEPEPVAAAPEAEPEPEAQPLAAATAASLQPEPEAPAPEPAVPPAPPVAASLPPAAPLPPAGPPQWPTGPRWPTAIPAHQTVPPPAPGSAADPLTAIMARQATEAMWAASSRDVVQPPLIAHPAPIAGVQPCVSCGISLSANARFCRRCGTSQAG